MFMFSRAIALVLASFVAGHATSPVNTPAGAPEDVRLVGVEGEGAKYRPRWRGPSGQGNVTGTNYADTWSDTQNIKWRVPVPGLGHSSPIIWRDHLFPTTATDDGASMSMLAFSRATGKQLWQIEGAVIGSRTQVSEEQPRVGDGHDRRPARLCVVRDARARGVRLHGQARVAHEARRPQQLSRQRGIAGAAQGPGVPLPGPRRHGDTSLVHRGLRRRNGQGRLEARPPRDRRVGLAGHHQHRHAGRVDRQQSAPRLGVRSRDWKRSLERARDDVRSHSDTGGGTRPGVLLVRTRRGRRWRSNPADRATSPPPTSRGRRRSGSPFVPSAIDPRRRTSTS